MIFYFTGTGNSAYVAKKIAEDLNLETTLITEENQVEKEYEVVGLVFPIYGWGPPAIVEKFMEKLKDVKSKYFFVVPTFAGNFGQGINRISRQKKVDLGMGVKMQDNYILWNDTPSQEKRDRVQQEADKKIEDIVNAIRNREEKKERDILAGNFVGDIIYKMAIKKFKTSDKNFWTTEDCDLCGLCEKVCPVGDIEITDKVVWKGKCEQCLRCIQFCPKKAINYGKKTEARGRYRHPSLKVSELIKK